jgi:hypothetical protein
MQGTTMPDVDPEPHRYVHGGSTDTPLKFSMYFPPAERYHARFFHPVMHIAGNENAALGRLAGLDGDSIGFAFAIKERITAAPRVVVKTSRAHQYRSNLERIQTDD